MISYTRRIHEQQNQLSFTLLVGRYHLICLRVSILTIQSWTFITKPMSNMKPEITIY